MPRLSPLRSAWVLAPILAVTACSRAGEVRDTGRAAAQPAGARTSQPFDFDHPLEALAMPGDTMASRVGSFAWEGEVSWSVEKPGVAPLRAVEHHRVRQLSTGDFDASADVDPGNGPGSVTGKHVVFVKGMAYGRGRWAPFRERPSDRGQDARRFRDDTLLMGADLARLYGPALIAQPAGEGTHAGRRVRRYRLALSGAEPVPGGPPPGLPGGYDADTKRHVAFLEGRVPVAASGELLLDAETGVPLSVVLKGSFSEREDPQLRADVELAARVKSLGQAVAPVQAPKGALADDRKPKGVARALEAAGLRQHGPGDQRVEGDEPADE